MNDDSSNILAGGGTRSHVAADRKLIIIEPSSLRQGEGIGSGTII
jgi:hypothetical protein